MRFFPKGGHKGVCGGTEVLTLNARDAALQNTKMAATAKTRIHQVGDSTSMMIFNSPTNSRFLDVSDASFVEMAKQISQPEEQSNDEPCLMAVYRGTLCRKWLGRNRRLQ